MTRRVQRQSTRQKPENTWSAVPAASSAQQRLHQRQIEMPEHPGDEVPRLPVDPTDLTDPELMTLFREFTEWVAYQGAQLAVADVEEQSAAETVKRIETMTTARNSGAKSVTAAKAAVWEDEAYIDARDEHFRAQAHQKILRGIYEATEKKQVLLSRELTRRVGRDPRDGRNSRWNA